MTGVLAQLVTLTGYGNAFLKHEKTPPGFDSGNSAFQFCNKIDFREFEKQFFFSKPREKVVAERPTEWFAYLRAGRCKHLRLYFEHSKDQRFAKEHKLAGFVGGGGTWLIECVYDGFSNYWANRWTVTDQNATDNKIWTVNYGSIGVRQSTRNLQVDNENIKSRLGVTLAEIAGFAFKHDLQGWGDQFAKAKSTLDSALPAENYYHKDLIPLDNYSSIAKQILFSAGSAWVFGGMGSWNDLGFANKEDNETYERLSEQLYSDINKAIIGAINTY